MTKSWMSPKKLFNPKKNNLNTTKSMIPIVLKRKSIKLTSSILIKTNKYASIKWAKIKRHMKGKTNKQ